MYTQSQRYIHIPIYKSLYTNRKCIHIYTYIRITHAYTHMHIHMPIHTYFLQNITSFFSDISITLPSLTHSSLPPSPSDSTSPIYCLDLFPVCEILNSDGRPRRPLSILLHKPTRNGGDIAFRVSQNTAAKERW